jgi:hypothetical protein
LRPVERPKAEALGYLEAEVAAAEAAGVMSADEGATRLVLFAEDGGVALSVGVKTIGFAALPGGTVFGVGDVPVGVALFGHGAEVLTEVFEGGASPAAAGVGEEGPVGADSGSIFVGFGDVVGADGDQTAVAYLHLAVELEEELVLAAVFGAEASTAKDEHHGVCPCSSESFRRVVV